jgi:bacterioferritin
MGCGGAGGFGIDLSCICGSVGADFRLEPGGASALGSCPIADRAMTARYNLSMKGKPRVIAELNRALREELTAINQYFIHAEMCENWGYERLSKEIKMQSIGEMKHAEKLIERILFLDGVPTMEPMALNIGQTVKQQLENDMQLELNAVEMYNKAVGIAREEGDNGSRELLEKLVMDEEEHVDYLETQLHQIQEMGYERYLIMQVGEKD